MNWVEKFKSGLFSKTQVIVGIVLTMLITSTFVYAFQILALNSFVPDTPISSSQVNQNFEQINEALSQIPVGMAVGLSSSFSYSDSMTPTILPIDRVFYDFTENQASMELITNETIPIVEDGFYQFLIYPKSASGSAEIRFLVGTNAVASVYMGESNTYFSPSNNHIYLESGMDLSIEVNVFMPPLQIDPDVFKIKMIKF